MGEILYGVDFQTKTRPSAITMALAAEIGREFRKAERQDVDDTIPHYMDPKDEPAA